MNITTYRCFGCDLNTGNQALVIKEFRSADPLDRLCFTQDKNKNASVFIDMELDSKIMLDFYYPHARSPLCIHATLAAGYFLLKEHDVNEITVFSALNHQEICISKERDEIFVCLQAAKVDKVMPDQAVLGAMLESDDFNKVLTYAFASVGSIKLLVEMDSMDSLLALSPNLHKIQEWNKAYGVSGIYAYCKNADGNFTGRNFNHIDASLEDAATGVSAGALAAFIGKDFTLNQGANLNNPCILKASQTDAGFIKVGGKVFEVECF